MISHVVVGPEESSALLPWTGFVKAFVVTSPDHPVNSQTVTSESKKVGDTNKIWGRNGCEAEYSQQ